MSPPKPFQTSMWIYVSSLEDLGSLASEFKHHHDQQHLLQSDDPNMANSRPKNYVFGKFNGSCRHAMWLEIIKTWRTVEANNYSTWITIGEYAQWFISWILPKWFLWVTASIRNKDNWPRIVPIGGLWITPPYSIAKPTDLPHQLDHVGPRSQRLLVLLLHKPQTKLC